MNTMSPMSTADTMGMMPGNMNMMMMPRCTMTMEKMNDGMKMMCVCDDDTAANMLQNLSQMMMGSMVSCCMMMNGMMMCCCNMSMGTCKMEMMPNGIMMTWASGDPAACKMIHSCCHMMMTMMDNGCMCCLCMNGSPICCSK